ncbi:MAG TPA: family 10 glycosylhydrolase [Blastocatellia bacterium]|nr:family 10 glycosylhydrolase [Blastocatellia bacterium]HMZ21036.1 family 10 glycosylhydrolase [Blastocatellia bacterium]HNG33943.1 family 10 glycosylhydrolase [Blastocatellia bacterium]
MTTPLCARPLLMPLLFLAATLLTPPAAAQSTPSGQYRGFWVDTFNTPLNNHNDVLAVVNNVRLANCNAVFVQVRRRGDSWYLNSLEPRADRTPIEAGFDPLADLIREAHANAIEVHAFVIIGAVWNSDPTSRAPESANHVFNQHGFNPATGRVYEGRANWLTRTLLPDTTGTDTSIRFGGHRFGSDFWIDLGHPDAADYTLRVLLHLVRNYDVDGLHLDRIRYPELAVSGQTPTSGVSIGYNETSVARFNKRYSLTGNPAQNDPQWNKWRRDQVTNFVRRVYLSAIAVKPALKVSAALIAFGGGPATESGWEAAECYWRVFQDWRAWTQEGILDVAVPMNYKREHTASQVPLLDTWNEWTKNHAYDRATLLGLGVFLNSVEGTLRQVRRAVAPSALGNRSQGVVFYSFAVSNEAVTANPFSFPPNQNTPLRPIAELAAGLTTGKSVNGSQAYEDASANPVAVFAQPAAVPVLQWKANPQVGHLMGIARTKTGEAIDAGEVTIARLADGTTPIKGRTSVTTATDGNGFYGGVDLAPGKYRVTVTPAGESAFATVCTATVVTGQVTAFDVIVDRTQAAVSAVSAASYCGPVLAPESIAAGFSNGISTAILIANTVPLPTQLAGASLAVKDSAGVERLSPLFFVSPGQMNFQVPPGTALGVASLTLTTSLGAPRAQTALIAPVAPGLFSANATGSGAPAAVVIRALADGSLLYEPASVFDPVTNRFVPRQIDLGGENEQVFLVLFGTGWRLRGSLTNVAARVGGLAAEVLYAGQQGDFIGLDQMNVKLPRALVGRGLVEAVLFAEGYSSNAVQINVK